MPTPTHGAALVEAHRCTRIPSHRHGWLQESSHRPIVAALTGHFDCRIVDTAALRDVDCININL
jgi:hypothetical protein